MIATHTSPGFLFSRSITAIALVNGINIAHKNEIFSKNCGFLIMSAIFWVTLYYRDYNPNNVCLKTLSDRFYHPIRVTHSSKYEILRRMSPDSISLLPTAELLHVLQSLA